MASLEVESLFLKRKSYFTVQMVMVTYINTYYIAHNTWTVPQSFVQ